MSGWEEYWTGFEEYEEDVLNLGDVREVQDYIDLFIVLREAEWQGRGYENPSRLRYAFSESFINAWKHGNRCDPRKTITVRYGYAESFVVSIVDEGDGFDVDEVPDPREGENVWNPSGRGVMLIRRFAGSVRWEDRGRCVVMTFERN